MTLLAILPRMSRILGAMPSLPLCPVLTLQPPRNSLELKSGANLGVIGAGIASVYAKEALVELGIEVSFLKICSYPVPKKLILELLKTVDAVLVFEELEPIVEEQVKMIAQEAGLQVLILGKANGFVSREGELDV